MNDKRQKKINSFLTKEFLEKEYILLRKNSTTIAKELGINHTSILNYLKKFNITIII